MKNNAFRFLFFIMLVLNLSFLAASGFHYFRHGQRWVTPCGKVLQKKNFLFERLSLDSAQLTSMKKKAVLFRAEIDRRRQEIARKNKVLIALMRIETPDVKAIESEIRAISARQEKMQQIIIGHMLDVKSSLSKDQQQLFLDYIENEIGNETGQVSCPSTCSLN